MLDIGCCPHCGRSLIAAIPLKRIMADTAEKYGVSIHSLTSRVRTGKLTKARQEISYRALTETSMNSHDMARAMKRDPTTIVFGAKAHAKRNNLPAPTVKWP